MVLKQDHDAVHRWAGLIPFKTYMVLKLKEFEINVRACLIPFKTYMVLKRAIVTATVAMA